MDHDLWTNAQSPINRKLCLKFEENWPRSFRGEVIQRCGWTNDRWTDRWWKSMASAHNCSSWAFGSGELKLLTKLPLHVIISSLLKFPLTLALSETDTVLGDTSVMATQVCSGGPNNHLSDDDNGVSGHRWRWVQLKETEIIFKSYHQISREKSPYAIWAASWQNTSLGICQQGRARSVCTSMQSDQCSLSANKVIHHYIIYKRRAKAWIILWYMQDDLNLCILHMFEGTKIVWW